MSSTEHIRVRKGVAYDFGCGAIYPRARCGKTTLHAQFLSILLWAHGPLGFGLWQLAFELRYVLGRVHGGLPGQGRRVPRHYTAADAWLPGCLAAWLPGERRS